MSDLLGRLRQMERRILEYDNGLDVFPDPDNDAEALLDELYGRLLEARACAEAQGNRAPK